MAYTHFLCTYPYSPCFLSAPHISFFSFSLSFLSNSIVLSGLPLFMAYLLISSPSFHITSLSFLELPRKENIVLFSIFPLSLSLALSFALSLYLSLSVQEGQFHNQGGDQGIPGEQAHLSGSGGSGHRSVCFLVANTAHYTMLEWNCAHFGVHLKQSHHHDF